MDMLGKVRRMRMRDKISISEIAKRSCTVTCTIQIAPQAEVPDLWLVFAPVKKTPAER